MARMIFEHAFHLTFWSCAILYALAAIRRTEAKFERMREEVHQEMLRLARELDVSRGFTATSSENIGGSFVAASSQNFGIDVSQPPHEDVAPEDPVPLPIARVVRR